MCFLHGNQGKKYGFASGKCNHGLGGQGCLLWSYFERSVPLTVIRRLAADENSLRFKS